MPATHLLGTTPATDEVIDTIAGIEMQRQVMEKEAGLQASCSSALRKLRELLDREKEALQLHHGSGTGDSASVDAVTIEIERVRRLAVITGQSHPSRNADPGGLRHESRQKSWQNAPRNPARNKGRRTMGRAGGR